MFTCCPDVFSWRYGLAKWASQGPSSTDIRAPDADLRWSVMAAVSRHRGDLEQDRHTALVKAFLGPQLEVLPGQLPAAFEADERADQFLTTDLLHLVHGRALIGVVRLKRHLALEGTGLLLCAGYPDTALCDFILFSCAALGANRVPVAWGPGQQSSVVLCSVPAVDGAELSPILWPIRW
eukprot:GHUV01029283.1.p1 GENE.GHUV01029283.1~~GHUV01029283.1.p1  ORF type:complete len:180 (+),score=64.08 GHUV01029283.1:986-1525(+)